jgi:L-serine dehydratase
MRAARRFVERLRTDGTLPRVARVRAELFGSLGLTGRGHGTDRALLLGLRGETPEAVDPDAVPALVEAVARERALDLWQGPRVALDPANDLVFHRRLSLPKHPNGMRLEAFDADGALLARREYYSVGGGFVVGAQVDEDAPLLTSPVAVPHPFASGADLLRVCRETGLSIAEVMRANEEALAPGAPVGERLLALWRVMRQCIERGCRTEGVLPGGLRVKRRAPALRRRLEARGAGDPLAAMDWVNLFALAVNEENAAGGRVVTAPTNGAAGVVPAVLEYYARFRPDATDEGVVRFLLTAGAVGILYKTNASISGAEVGCQGEVGVACSMAAAGLVEACGGTPAQAENAAEIGMEHNLGLTCDPVGGLVQVPCIERNAMGAVKAINAARLALGGDGTHAVSLDRVIATMRQTGADMKTKYKETARGGLAVNVIEC